MEIFDPLRKKYVRLTPEEEVRQNVIGWLAQEWEVPLPLMSSEWAFTFNGMQYRADLLVFDRSLQPLMLVECKAPDVPINQMVVDQVIRYNLSLKVKYILITNGKSSYLCAWNPDTEQYQFLDKIPKYEQML
ncbi:MAG: type I restriction enzyme HsdR N-terminal domain-containing protein [Bacteroidales bacterium]|nr:type I restriction enzyme HsdR N-terminal domain-containing protein [Bacteroidales bacterium]